MLSEISQIKKDKYCMVSLIRVIKKKKSQTHRTREWKSSCQGLGNGGGGK